jgi:hypothetical protein
MTAATFALPPDRAERNGLGAPWLPALLLATLVQLAGVARDHGAVLRGDLLGADSYMRLNRVAELIESGDWFSRVFTRSNAPWGETMHWTRALDTLLLAGAAPLSPLLGWRDALHVWGALLSPVLHVLALLALYWADRPLLDREGRTYLGFVFLFPLAVAAQFAIGEPDHHSLLGLMFVLALGCAIRLAARECRLRVAAWAALPVAVAIWTSVEGLVTASLLLGVLGFGWLARGERFAARAAAFCAAAAAALVLVLLIERGPGFFVVDYGAVSVVHLALFVLLAGFWLLMARFAPPLPIRLAWAMAGAAFVGGAMRLAFPKFFAGPLAEIDQRVLDAWFSSISEVQSPLFQPDPLSAVHLLLNYAAPAVAAALYLPWLIRRQAGDARRGWLALALALAMFLPLALWQIRWTSYAQLAAAPAYAALLLAILDRLGLRTSPPPSGDRALQVARAAAVGFGRTLVVLLVGGGFLLASAVVRAGLGAAEKGSYCRMDGMAAYLAQAYPQPKRIMAYIFNAPELLYRTRHSVVATPYPHNQAGLLDTLDFFGARDDGAARAIAAARGLDLVLACPKDEESGLYRKGGATLLTRLEAGAPPAWLAPVALPPALAADYRLYEVRP